MLYDSHNKYLIRSQATYRAGAHIRFSNVQCRSSFLKTYCAAAVFFKRAVPQPFFSKRAVPQPFFPKRAVPQPFFSKRAVPQPLRNPGDLRPKMDVRCCNVAGSMCAVPHLTYIIPDRNSGAAAAPHVKKNGCVHRPLLSL